MRKNFGVKPWFYPLPVLIVGSYDENGQADAMNEAWGGLYDANLVELCLSSGHKTTKNINIGKIDIIIIFFIIHRPYNKFFENCL